MVTNAILLILLLSITAVIRMSKSCSILAPSDGYLYVDNFQLLSDPNSMLLTITAYNIPDVTYCKILNVSDGSVSDVVSCDQDTRDWSTGDTDPTSTSITSALDNNDGTVDIILSRNDLTIGITGITYSASASSNLYYDQFTLSSIYSTFVLLSPSQYTVEMIRITFKSESDNSAPTVVNMGTTSWQWGKWEIGNDPNMIPVYENAYALQLPLVCCLCDSQWIARYYFDYDASSGDISGIQIDKQVYGGIVDTLGQKAYDWFFAFPAQITVYDLSNIGGASNTYILHLNYTTASPTTNPTHNPSVSPTSSTLSPTDSPITVYPTIYPTTSPTRTDDSTQRYTTIVMDIDTAEGIDIMRLMTIGSAIDYTLYYLIGGIIFLFAIVFILSWLDSKCCCRRNDYFQISALFSALFQVLDMLSDVFFAINALSYYQDTYAFELLLIFIASTAFIIIPIIISLYQLHAASSKYWLYNNRMREWLLLYSKLLLIASVLSGSPFASIQIFNSNMFGLDVFYMGLPKQYLLSFTTKKIYSIILFENCPQLVLSVWYSVFMGELTWIPAVQITFSLISIITTFISMVLQKKIYKTQDYVYITIDIKGQCIMDNITICKNRINGIKSFLCRRVLGINEKSVEIQKPFTGSVPNGLQLQIHITFIHHKSVVNPEREYEQKLLGAVKNGSFQQNIVDVWKLSNAPQIGDIQCRFVQSKQKQMSLRNDNSGMDKTNATDESGESHEDIPIIGGIEIY